MDRVLVHVTHSPPIILLHPSPRPARCQSPAAQVTLEAEPCRGYRPRSSEQLQDPYSG
jgi:hypothetical protein